MKKIAKRLLNKQVRISLRRLWFSGTKYYCNVCGNNVRTMFTMGYAFPVLAELHVIGRERMPLDACPVCFSNSRPRLLFHSTKVETQMLNARSLVSVLHIAPEYAIS